MGEPLRLMVDLPNEEDAVALFAHTPGSKRLVASSDGRGFVVAEADAVAQTRTGKQILNTDPLSKAAFCVLISAEDDTVATVGENRKMLVFPLAEMPEMGRGKGVLLQRYKDGGLADIRTLTMANGLNWQMGGGKTRTVPQDELSEWSGKRASAGRMAPRGFPRDNKFS